MKNLSKKNHFQLITSGFLIGLFLFFSSCQKDNFSIEQQNKVKSKQEGSDLTLAIKENNVTTKKITNIFALENASTSRSSWRVVSAERVQLRKGQWYVMGFPKEALDRAYFKAETRPTSGDPDLSTWGYSPWRRIATSEKGGLAVDALEFNSTLLSHETEANFAAYAYTDCDFTMTLYMKEKSSSSGSGQFPATVLRKSNNTPSTSSTYGTSLNVFNDDGEGGQNLVGQCTWYAYGRTVELARQGYLSSSAETLLSNGLKEGTERHAKNWTWKVNGNWYDTNSSALPEHLRKKGMIVVWKNATDPYGHVAFVESVSEDKKYYTVSDFNRHGKTTYRTRTFPFEGNDKIGLMNGTSWYPYFLPLQ